jgi:hypothetical protein
VRHVKESEVRLLKHIRMHLRQNNIDIEDRKDSTSWYCGNHAQFVKTHKEARELLNRLIEQKGGNHA